MPSIPQSLLWISLVVLWLFVLVPMLIGKRDAVRRTSDVALATRVLNNTSAARLLKRSRPAAGHRSDPDWQPTGDGYSALDDDLDEAEPIHYVDRRRKRATAPTAPTARSVVVVAAVVENVESQYLDVDVVDDDSGALPVGGMAEHSEPVVKQVLEDGDEGLVAEALTEPHAGAEVPADDVIAGDVVAGDEAIDEAIDEDVAGDWPGHGAPGDAEDDGSADEYDHVDDTSGLEVPADSEAWSAESLSAARRRRYESKTAETVSARKYKFRTRVLAVLALVLVGSAAVAYTVAPAMWWVCGSASGITMLYLGYLRRQTRIEAQLRQRRVQRMARSRLGVENTDDREFDVVPSRLRRPGAVVLDIDDEDPVFEHLGDGPGAGEYDLPRAAGQ
jgi:hypothetical protein